jgi:hypothetical protein
MHSFRTFCKFEQTLPSLVLVCTKFKSSSTEIVTDGSYAVQKGLIPSALSLMYLNWNRTVLGSAKTIAITQIRKIECIVRFFDWFRCSGVITA